MPSNSSVSITLPVSIQAEITNISDQIRMLERALGNVKIDTRAYRSLSTILSAVQREFNEIRVASNSAFSSQAQLNSFSRRLTRLNALTETFSRDFANLDYSSLLEGAIDPEALAQIQQAEARLTDLQEQLENLASTSFNEALSGAQELQSVLSSLGLSKDSILNGKAAKEIQKNISSINREIQRYQNTISGNKAQIDRNNLLGDNFTKELEDARFELDYYTEELKEAQTVSEEELGRQRSMSALRGRITSNQNLEDRIKEYQEQLKTNIDSNLNQYFDQATGQVSDSSGLMNYLRDKLGISKKMLQQLNIKDITTSSLGQFLDQAVVLVNQEIEAYQNRLNQMAAQDSSNTDSRDINEITADLRTAEARVNELVANLEKIKRENASLESEIARREGQMQEAEQRLQTTRAAQEQEQAVRDAYQSARQDESLNQQIRDTSNNISEMANEARNASPSMKGVSQAGEEISGSLRGMNGTLAQSTAEFQRLSNAEQQLQGIRSAITQWLGFNEVVNLTRNAVRDAYQHIAELDSIMTEIAIVTDMTQEDLWGQIDTYSALAQQYGTTIQGVYQVSQLWFQQGRSEKI